MTNNSKAKHLFAALCAAVVSASATAGETIHYQGTANYRDHSGIANSDITNTVKWGISEFSAENDYVIDGGRFCGFEANGTFPGKSLTLGSVGGTAGSLKNGNNVSGTYHFDNLTLNKGQIYVKTGNKKINAAITVNAESSSPFKLSVAPGWGGVLELQGSIGGSGDFQIGRDESESVEYEYTRIVSDMSTFTGTVFAGIKDDTSSVNYRSIVYLGDISIGGGLTVRKSGVISFWRDSKHYGEFSTGRLSFSDGGTIRVGVNTTTGGTVRVTESLTLPPSGTVTLDIRGLPAYNFSIRRHPILIAPANSGMSEDKFVVTSLDSNGTAISNADSARLKACHLEVDDTSPGFEILYLVVDKYTCLTTVDSWGSSCWSAENSARWSGVAAGTPMDPEMVYVSHDKQVVTPSGNVVFGGKRFVFSGQLPLIFCAGSVSVDDLVLMAASKIRFYDVYSSHLHGNLRLANPVGGISAVMYEGENHTATIHANISGNGALSLLGSNNTTPLDARANFNLYGINTAFAGKLCVTNAANSALTNTVLCVADARSLGGPMASFTYDGVSFYNWSRLDVTNSLAITEPTRGVFFSGGNYVRVTGETNMLTLATQTTLAGTLVKEGAGTLALGGTVKFTTAQLDTPLTGTNVLEIVEGRIRPASKGGADGLSISFASGTGLRLAPFAETDDDVLRYGLYNVKTDTPFNLTATGGKLNVALDLPVNIDELPREFSFSVCTVSSAAASALQGNIILSKIKGYGAKFESVSNGDGTVTFKATCGRTGFVLSYR